MDNDQCYNIIGDKDQILQLLLKPKKSIIVKKSYLHYLSANINQGYLKEKLDLFPELIQKNEEKNRIKAIKTSTEKPIDDKSLVKLTNTKLYFEYVGISNGGRILTFSPFLYNHLYIRFDKVLAYTENIDLVENTRVTKELNQFLAKDNILFKNNKYYLVNIINNELITSLFKNISLQKYSELSEKMFIHSDCIFY
jgi:hypothetical protein